MRRLFPLLTACLAALSCAPPPFNLELSLSARTALSLTAEGTIGPIDKKAGGDQVVDAVFFPERGPTTDLDLRNGFLLSTYAWGDRNLGFISWNATKNIYMQAGATLGFGKATTDPFPGFQMMNLKGAAHSIGVFAFTTTDPSQNQFDWGQADPTFYPEGIFPVITNPTEYLGGSTGVAATPFGIGEVIGVSRYPSTDPAQDTTYWLFRTTSVDTFREGSAPVDASGILSLAGLPSRPSTPYSLGGAAPANIHRALYYYDPEPVRAPERSYLSWYDQGTARWRCVWWSGMTPPLQATELKGVSHRVDAVLTTGELFSAEGGMGRVYSRDGTPVKEFPLSGMHFLEERFVNGTARMLFTQYLYYDKSGWVVIYSIPTKDLDTLPVW